jgi:hypothetical protein
MVRRWRLSYITPSPLAPAPQDDAAIAAALAALGAHHAALAESLVAPLLGTVARSQFLAPDASLEQV